MSVPLLDTIFKQAVKGCSIPIQLVSNQKSGRCAYAAGLLFYNEGVTPSRGNPRSLLANFSTKSSADDQPLQQIFSDVTFPHVDPPQPFYWDPKDLGVTISADGAIKLYPGNQTKNLLTFTSEQEGLNQVIFGVALGPSSISNPQSINAKKQVAPLYVISFGKIIPPSGPIM